MKIAIIVIAALIALAYGQDASAYPDTLLADINPGPDSSSPRTWYIIESAGKAYTSVNITGKLFDQIVVTDGTSAGTKLINEINTSQRGDPFAKDPFWVKTKDNPIYFSAFDGMLWVSLYNYNTSAWDIYTVDPKNDILKKYTGGIIKMVTGEYGDKSINIQEVRIFKGEYFAFSSDIIYHGLQIFDKTFSSFDLINNATQFMITPDLYDPFAGFDDSSGTYLLTDNYLFIEGWVQNNGGLWAFDGTTVWPLNLDTQYFHDSWRYYDAVHNKFYYIAFFNNLPQLVVNDLNDLNSTYTILTNLNQNCVSTLYDCFSYLGAMDVEKGTVAFAYNTQLGFSDGTLAGTTFLVGSPRAADVLGAYNGKFYFKQYTDSTGYLMVTDGTKDGSKVVLEHPVNGGFHPINGVVIFKAGTVYYRLDKNESITLVRDGLPALDGEFARVTLANNHSQLYFYYSDSRSCGRGCTRHYYYLYVTDGSGIVQFSGNFGTSRQNVFLNYRFLMSSSSDATGVELFYMDHAAESYKTPPPLPGGPLGPEAFNPTSGATQSKVICYLLMLIPFLLF